MIKRRLLASLFILLIAIIEVPFMLIGCTALLLYPMFTWIYWVITGKSIMFIVYIDNIICFPLIACQRFKICKKIATWIDWSIE